jgi:hypothetical protein
VERLSVDLRDRLLSAAERAELSNKLKVETSTQVYEEALGAWLDKAAYTRLLDVYWRPSRLMELFFIVLDRWRDPEREAWVYYAPHAHRGRGSGPPCAPEERIAVRPWWGKEPVLICSASYHPEKSFDASGFCGDQGGGFDDPYPPRDGCGCGPSLIDCFPPEAAEPGLAALLDEGLHAEVIETAYELMQRGRPIDEIVTTSRTWQTGLVELLYLRRELLADLHDRPYTPQLGQEVERRLSAVDARAAGRWIERRPPYVGSGLLAMPAIINGPVRTVMRNNFNNLLCVRFESVHVDAEVLLQSVKKRTDIGSTDIVSNSPMRHQPGCEGCHAPIDSMAGFYEGLRSVFFGTYVTHAPERGQLFLKGAKDYRGEGNGLGQLAKLIVTQPEFTRCNVWRVFRAVVRREPKYREEALVDGLAKSFDENGRRFDWLVGAVLRSNAYVERGLDP